MHHKRRPRSTRLKVLLVAKVVILLARGPKIMPDGKYHSGALDPLISFLLAHKEVGKSRGVKAK